MAQGSTNKAKLLGFLTILLGMLLIAVALLKTNLLSEIENRTWDWRIKLSARPEEADPSIKIVMIDQSSLEFFANEESIFWPWPRGIYEAVIKFLTQSGARGVAFDVLYSEQSSYGVDDDEAFAKSFEGAPPVVSAVALRRSAAAEKDAEFDAFKEKALQSKFTDSYVPILKELDLLNPFTSITLPVLPLLKSSAAFGNVTAQPDSDGIYRHTKIGSLIDGTPVIGLPFALFEVGRKSEERHDLRRFLDADGELAVNFHGPARTYPTFKISGVIQSLRQIQNGEAPLIPLDTFKNSWVFLGMDAPGLLDLRPTPLAELYPGVEFHANVLDNILHGNFAMKATFLENLLLIYLIVLIIAGGIVFSSNSRIQFLIVSIVFVAVLLLLFFAASHGMWINATVPFVCGVGALLAAISFQYQLEGRQHRFIKSAFKYYVSPELIEEIVKDPSSLSLGGAKRELTIFFSDLEGFTSISERLDPQKLVQLLNQYLTAMTDIILASGGTLDKYEGDAIIAFWNAPLTITDHASRAIRAALACQKKLNELNLHFKSEFGVTLKMRIGLHTGFVSVGNFGSKERFNYTILGDAANLASRLEGVNKVFGTYILISEATKDQLNTSIMCRKIGAIRVVGKSLPAVVYEPISGVASFDAYHKALAQYESGNLTEALKLFNELGDDPVAKAYIEKIKQDQTSSEAFDPIWILSSK